MASNQAAGATGLRQPRARGFTLIEMLVTVAIVAILAGISYPSYAQYIAKQKLNSGEADLVALALNMESYLQNNTQYPSATANTATTKAALPGWAPVQVEDFNYAIAESNNAVAPATYTLVATGISKSLAGCTATLKSDNTRVLSGCPKNKW